MVAEGNRPVNAELLHECGKKLCTGFVVEGSRLERNGIRYVSRDNNKVGLFRRNHCGNGIERHCVLFKTHKAGADVNVSELKNFEVSVGGKSPVSVLVRLQNGDVILFDLLKGQGFFCVDSVAYIGGSVCRYDKGNKNTEDYEENLYAFFSFVRVFWFFTHFIAPFSIFNDDEIFHCRYYHVYLVSCP